MDPKNADDVLAAEKVVAWLRQSVIDDATGQKLTTMTTQPSGTFWLGRLTSEDAVFESGLDSRGDRLDPCSLGLRLLPRGPAPWRFTAKVIACAWTKKKDDPAWHKMPSINVTIPVTVSGPNAQLSAGQPELRDALASVGANGLSARLDIDAFPQADGRTELTILLVNSSPKESKDLADTRLYECSLTISELATDPYALEQLPDVFRYDRYVPAYGINCGVSRSDNGALSTIDDPTSLRMRPAFWPEGIPEPKFRFDALAADPLPLARELLQAFTTWGDANWSDARLDERRAREGWNDEISERAKDGAKEFRLELDRIRAGVDILASNMELSVAFRAMNAAMVKAAHGKYDTWRPFQFGFLLANLSDLATGEGRDVADVVWFATGGGKTETYLGILITAAFLDRLRGKAHGITAWSRFPLRMLSLQQTQRFANALAAAELVRREQKIEGEPFSLGFLVGSGATPNAIKPEPGEGEPDPDDDDMPKQFQMLERCPFCRADSIVMPPFDHSSWTLRHSCSNPDCPWEHKTLPLYVVDDEIYRFLPTIIVGTLDKAANIGMQAAMRGFVGAPAGLCSTPGHGHVYAKRSTKPNGCLVPGCTAQRKPLPQDAHYYAISFRLQDELHLLRDSLGAIDAHYEALLDGLEDQICGVTPKILASSATLSGYDKQVDVLYRRKARVFPQPSPEQGRGFWARDTSDLMRTYVALAPRGVTIEHATDRILTVLQRSIRALVARPDEVCRQLGVDPAKGPGLVSLYGTDVVYGNTLRDLDAVSRSIEGQQVLVEGPVRTATLTGRTEFPDVRKTLRRLENPEPAFQDRIHVITASSMMSHGVDIDRLNVMTMIGLPLGTAEFIQTSARVGRTWPGLIFVLHKIARERDAGVFRTFEKFVEHGDRFVEPIPITRRSRRVLERTLPGLMHARLLHLHEAGSGEALTTPARVKAFRRQGKLDLAAEEARLIEMLGIQGALDEPMKEELKNWIARYSRLIDDPVPGSKFSSDLYPGELGPMRSLRDVEESVPIYGREDE